MGSIASFSLRLALALTALAAAPAFAQPGVALSPEAAALFTQWMTSSCLGDDAARLRDGLRQHGAELAPAFRNAVAQGPPAASLNALRATSGVRYAALARVPGSEVRVEGISQQNVARFARVTRESFVSDQVQRYATGYRSNAIAGLAIVGGADSKTLLTRLARRDDMLAPAAKHALRALEQR